MAVAAPRTRTATISRRRLSTEPGFYTRAEVEADLGLSSTERDTFERAGILGPTLKRLRGDTRPVLYSTSDLAVARFAMTVHRMGVRGEALKRLTDALRLKQRRLVAGWTGHVVVDGFGDLELLAAGRSIDGALTELGSPASALLVALSVPYESVIQIPA